METATNTKNTMTLFGRANSQFFNTMFFSITTTISSGFSPVMNRSLHATSVKNLHDCLECDLSFMSL